MTPSSLALVVVGVVGTWLGAELLVRGASRIALGLGVRPLTVGLTVVAFGTSSPEAVASIVAVSQGSGALAVGNVLGSNVANLGLILGSLALLHPLPVNWNAIRYDVAILIAVTFLAAGLAAVGGGISRVDGVVLLLLMGVYLAYYLREARGPSDFGEPEGQAHPPGHRLRALMFSSVLTVVGFAVLVGGAWALVDGAKSIALAVGVPEGVVGATVVAIGTSLPELAASIVAVARGHYDIGVGNIVGSNVFNLLMVLGAVGTIRAVPVEGDALWFFGPVMIAFTLVAVIMMRTSMRVTRLEGAMLLGGYIAFCIRAYN